MFRGNKLVLILPAILAIVMLIGGYHFLESSEAITNEELQDVIELDLNTNKTAHGMKVTANWDWTVMPAEGLYGEDYIGIVIMERDTMTPRTDIEVEGAVLELLYADRTIEQSEGTMVENGIIFPFSNKIEEHESFGNVGRLQVEIFGEDIEGGDVFLTLIHTWTEHAPLEMTDASLSSPTFTGAANVPHWSLRVSNREE
ncbi:hypothetical protein [Halalkalibacter okhensis]|uniref:Uncharacterized protein n=1 Tax=Halalkalibacter okhensis TaxID=333138 RepID=A0A0B0IQ83_9BACI|nr:hypothetical protein [Halalkalibacter okhensis]KHF41816.1 hypothetical protein LQ50_00515 [Halalkalibacter okhensis]